MRRVLVLTFLLVIFAANAAWPESRTAGKNLTSIEKDLAAGEQKQERLEKEARSLESEIRTTRRALVKTADAIQENERVLKDLETRMAQLEARKKKIDESLLEDRQSLARLVLALERLRRVPPEALIAKPGAPLQAAQSALLMQEIMPALYQQAEKLRANLSEVSKITEDLEKKRAKALAASAELKKEHESLNLLVSRREDLFEKTNKDLKTQQENVRRISQQARNLHDLVQKLDQKSADDERAALTRAAMAPPRPGQPRLPVSGIIRTAYGEEDNFGAPSQGLIIESRHGALVVAPMGGIVQFAGFFKNYGQLVIIEHQNGYHSLVAGLKKLDTVVGQSVAAGEPLGLLDKTSDGSKPTLYYELRLNGRPVNPAGKFTDLG